MPSGQLRFRRRKTRRLGRHSTLAQCAKQEQPCDFARPNGLGFPLLAPRPKSANSKPHLENRRHLWGTKVEKSLEEFGAMPVGAASP